MCWLVMVLNLLHQFIIMVCIQIKPVHKMYKCTMCQNCFTRLCVCKVLFVKMNLDKQVSKHDLSAKPNIVPLRIRNLV